MKQDNIQPLLQKICNTCNQQHPITDYRAIGRGIKLNNSNHNTCVKCRRYEAKTKWRLKNKKRLYAAAYKWARGNTQCKVSKLLRSRVLECLKKTNTVKTTRFNNLLGCSIEHAIKHIESLFKPGMSWDNHGLHGWHIDHILPCSRFDLTDVEQQKKCFHYTNLQPLWAKENLSKWCKLL